MLDDQRLTLDPPVRSRHRLNCLVALAAFLALPAVLAITSSGCTKTPPPFFPMNERPSVDLTAAPVSSSDTAFYSYRLYWSGNDPDGRVVAFQYVIDPPTAPDSDTLWITTYRNEEQVNFRATKAYWTVDHGWRSNDFHTFVLRAVDNLGAISKPVSRAFYSYTIAPTVFVTKPQPSSLLTAQVTPSVRINWQGRDEDGIRSQKPVKYRYRLFRSGDPDYDPARAIQNPDSLRLFFAARNFAGWDSVGGDTTWAQYRGLTPGAFYLFVVVAIDEAGAYSPAFSLNENMLKFTAGFANTLGPIFTVWSDFFYYRYASGGYSLDPLAWINLEVPVGVPLTIHWSAEPPEGANIEWYRWRVGGDVGDETPRSNENTDLGHWSRRSNLTTSATVGPFAGKSDVFVYIECMDNNGMNSLAVVHINSVVATLEKDLVIVDDTRLEVDKLGATGVPTMYATEWPSAAELDTFLYARGGYPWRGPQGVSGNLPLSRPGVFAGYSCDTIGTRQGYELANVGVPLSLLGHYRNLIWMTDITGASPTAGGSTAAVNPLGTLRWMSDIGRANTLSTYAFSGGRVWLLGGTAGYSSSIALNATGNRNNDAIYGPGKSVFSSAAGEVVPGRIMFSNANWRSEFVQQTLVTNPTRSPRAVGGWSNPGWGGAVLIAPDYSKLPATLRRRSLALGDTLPPTRAGRSIYFYSSGSFSGEYLVQDNAIIEDVDPNPLVEDQRSVLDTLYEFRTGDLVTTRFTGRQPASMTYYHGGMTPQFIFSGFDIWAWSRRDVVALVDFVLQDIWGLHRSPEAQLPPFARAAPSTSPGTQSLPSGGALRGGSSPAGRARR